jgi:Ca-activated chloride channel family protein
VGILAPLALALLALALPIIALYMLRQRRPAVPVSSILLWEAVLTDLEANAPWQRLRRNWLLLLQLLILLLLVLALARPYATAAGAATGNTVVVLDSSASMRATDVAPSRFERARAEARALIDRLGAGQRLALILAGPTAEVRQAPTSDGTALRAALDRLQPGAGLVNWPDALALADATARRLPGSQVVVITDGAFPPLDPAAVTVPTRFITVGASGDNLAITALATGATGGGASVFARVRNTGPATRALLTLSAGDRLLDARALALDAGGEVGVTFDGLPATGEPVRAELDVRDALAEDNRAWAVLPAAGRALLVSPGASAFLRRGLALLPETHLLTAPASEPGYDWYVFDGITPERLPGNSLIINPPAGEALVPVAGQLERPRVTRAVHAHPLLAGVDLDRLHIARAARIEPPAWLQPLVEADGGPLLLAGEHDGQRAVVLAFDLHQSDLPLSVAFPVLLSNVRAWLHPATGPVVSAPEAVVRPGEPVTVNAGPEIDAIVVTLPDGRQQTLAPAGGVARLTDTGQLGPYRLSLRAGGQERRAAWLAVNLLSDEESALAPAAHPPLGAVPAAAPAAEPAPQELWRPLLLLGMLLLLAEWWLFYRGPALPGVARRRRTGTTKPMMRGGSWRDT